MDIEKMFGENLPPVLKELLALMLSEWMTVLSRKQERKILKNIRNGMLILITGKR